jgi:hypothetical protein
LKYAEALSEDLGDTALTIVSLFCHPAGTPFPKFQQNVLLDSGKASHNFINYVDDLHHRFNAVKSQRALDDAESFSIF